MWPSLDLAAEKQHVHCIPDVRIRRLCVPNTTESCPQNWEYQAGEILAAYVLIVSSVSFKPVDRFLQNLA